MEVTIKITSHKGMDVGKETFRTGFARCVLEPGWGSRTMNLSLMKKVSECASSRHSVQSESVDKGY